MLKPGLLLMGHFLFQLDYITKFNLSDLSIYNTSCIETSGTMSIIFMNKIGIPSYAPSASRLHAKPAL